MKRVFLTLLVSVAATLSMAQPSMDPPTEVTNLKWMTGTWTGKGKMSMQGTDMEIATVMTCLMEGQFFKIVSTYDMGQMKMEESQYVGWDPDKKEYFSYAFTNMAPVPRVEHGKMDGAAMVMTSEPWVGQTGRSTVTKISDTKLKFMLEFKIGDNWEKSIEMELTKK